MDNGKTKLSEEELRTKRLERKWLLAQRNRMGYGLSLGTVLLFFGIGGGKTGLLWIGGLAIAVGLYFFLRFEKQRRELEEILRKYYPNGIPDKQSK